ncbi:MAG: helix-turn-helix transcriptional regulator [Cytophagales bacterium]|nr:helix-turn-helix transcriptional regulator [Cytophagales bacterium]
MKVNFPSYFNNNPNFKSLEIGKQFFVDYSHNLDTIKDVQLSIDTTFIAFVLKGEAQFCSYQKTELVKEGEGFLVKKGSYMMSENLNNGEFQALLFFIPDELIQKTNLQMKLTPEYQENDTMELTINTCKITLNPLLQSYVTNMLHLLLSSNTQSSSTQFMEMKVMELVYYLYENDSFLDKIRHILSPVTNIKINEVVQKYLYEDLRIEELAFMCHMSVSTFKRKFQENYHMPPKKYIKKKRLEQAHHLLLTTNVSVIEISENVGFSSYSHFITSFKQMYDMPPLQLRKAQ